MAKRSTKSVATEVQESSRLRTFKQGETRYEIWSSEADGSDEKRECTAKNAPAALATLELATSMGRDSGREFYVQKVSRLSVANGQLTE
jgi:hypothetical protein